MTTHHKAIKTVPCLVCKQDKPSHQSLSEAFLNPSIRRFLQLHYSTDPNKPYSICLPCLDHIRNQYIQYVIVEEQEKLLNLQQEVNQSLQDQDMYSQNINIAFDRELTLGEKMADKVATFGGSWTFILFFCSVLLLWIAINSIHAFHHFDPYPYIFLNLLLSTLAAVQAPIIMMSQNRHEAKDRLQSENDYKVNLKAELEIRHLHAKLDMLLTSQWHRLLEIQQIQIELMEEIANHRPSRPA